MENREIVLEALREWGVPFDVLEHAPVHTMEDCMRLPGVDGARTEMPKNVCCCNRQQTDYYLVLLRHDLPFRTAVVSRALGVSRLSFAPDEALPGLLGLRAGAVSPLGLLFDGGRRVRLVIDQGLRAFERLAFHPCDAGATVILRGEDFFQIVLRKMNRVPAFIDPAPRPDAE